MRLENIKARSLPIINEGTVRQSNDTRFQVDWTDQALNIEPVFDSIEDTRLSDEAISTFLAHAPADINWLINELEEVSLKYENLTIAIKIAVECLADDVLKAKEELHLLRVECGLEKEEEEEAIPTVGEQ